MCTEQRRTTKPHCSARLSSDPSVRSRRVFQAEEATGATISYRKRALRRGQDRLYPIHPGAVRILHGNGQINQARKSKITVLRFSKLEQSSQARLKFQRWAHSQYALVKRTRGSKTVRLSEPQIVCVRFRHQKFRKRTGGNAIGSEYVMVTRTWAGQPIAE